MSVMHKMFNKRTLVVALLAGSGVLAATSFAMPGGGGPGDCAARQGDKPGMSQGQQVQSKREAFRAKRLAALKDKLRLKPEQEAAWQAFADAPRPGPQGMDRQAMREQFKSLNTPQRMDKMLSMADERRAHLVQRAETVKRFYAQLTAEQQKVFDAEARMFRPGQHRHHHHGGPGLAS